MFSEETYSDFVAVRVKGGEDILAGLDHGKCDLLHMAIGISGEANVAKLQKRYPVQYSDAHAIARADKPSGQ